MKRQKRDMRNGRKDVSNEPPFAGNCSHASIQPSSCLPAFPDSCPHAPVRQSRCVMVPAEGGTHGISHSHRIVSFALFMLLALLNSLTSPAQTYPYREYTIDDGLPQSEPMAIFQDSRDYMWVSTRNGLARFDGQTFIPYMRKDGLPSNIVTTVFEDRDGTIWAVTSKGLGRFNGRNFNSFPVPDHLRIKNMGMGCDSGDTATFFLTGSVDAEGDKILLFRNGRYHDYTMLHPILSGKGLKPAAFDTRDSALYLLNRKSEVYKFQNERLVLINKGPVTKVILTETGPQYENDDGTYGLVYVTFLNEIDGSAPYLADKEGTRWLRTQTQLFRLLSDAFIEYDKDNGLPDNAWALVADPSGGLWIGTLDHKLRYFDGKSFTDRNEFLRLYDTPPAFYRGSTTMSNGEVWISTNVGVLIWDGKRFRRLDLLKEPVQVCIIYEDPVNKNILLGADKGLYIIDGSKVTLYPQMSWLGYGIPEGIARDHQGNYWLAGHYGMVFFDGENFIPFRSAPAPVEMSWGVVCDYMGNIWSVGSDGTFICDPDDPAFTKALPEEINLPSNVIRDIGDNRLLIGRMADLCIIDLQKYYSGQPDYYKIIGRTRGFTGNDCQDNGIVKDAAGNWWILTSDKLIRFDPDKIVKNEHPPMSHITLVETANEMERWETVLDSVLYYDTNSLIHIRGRQNHIRISYTGISTSNPEDVTYQYRMKDIDNDWSDPDKERSVTYNHLPTGRYLFEVRAINADGVATTAPDTLEINVVPTFFQSYFARIMLTIIGLTLIVLLSWQIRKNVLLRRVEAARQQAESYRLQLNSVIKQFDPHFTFNAVTSVGSLIMKGEKEKAYNYFIKLSNLLRSIISDSPVLLKPLEQEIEFVTRYCELQKLRFGTRFEYTITVAEDVDLKTSVPKMIIQSFAENAIKHGLENKKGHGLMEIIIINAERGIEVTVRDNGIGRDAASALSTGGPGTGLKNIRSIIDTMNRANAEKITFTLTDLYTNGKASGTEVRVFLPYNYSIDFPTEKI